MTVRAVEWKLPYTWWKAITVDENKVISLNLRDENNLIIYDQGDDEIYVDLQLPDWIRPNYALPVWITTGRVLVADDWDVTWTIIVAKTTSWDVIKLLYGDDWTLWMDNGTGLFKQIYFKADVDLIITNLTNYINTELAKKQDKLIAGNNISIASDGKTISAIIPPLARFLSLWDCETWEPTSFPASTPFTYATWDYYLVWTVDTTTNYRPNGSSYTGTASSTVETSTVVVWDVYIYDGSAWLLQKNSGTGWAWDVQVSTDTGNLLSTGVKLWLGDKSDFDNLVSLDANTIYAPIEWMQQPRTPSANTIAYFPLAEDWLDVMWNYTLDYTWTQQTVGRLFTQQSELSSIPTGVGTTLVWMYINNKDAASSSNYVQVARNTSWNLNLFISWTANAPCFSLYIPNTTYKAGDWVITTGNWYLIATTREKVWSTSTIKGYINWTEYTIYSGSGASNDADYAALIFANGTVDMVLSRYIIESKVWTADEITTYYNQTKWNYGL